MPDIATEDWERLDDFPCSCGVTCRQWRDRLRCLWRVAHGTGEAVRTFTDEEIVSSIRANGGSVWWDWITHIHAYEGG